MVAPALRLRSLPLTSLGEGRGEAERVAAGAAAGCCAGSDDSCKALLRGVRGFRGEAERGVWGLEAPAFAGDFGLTFEGAGARPAC